MIDKIKFIDEISIKDKTVLLRVDLNVTLNGAGIANDIRIRQVVPTIKFLRSKKNKLILVSHLSSPRKRDTRYSLKVVLNRLQELLPEYSYKLVDDFKSAKGRKIIRNQKKSEVLLLENIRFHEGEKKNDPFFAKELSKIADVYVNDAFAVSHRKEASVVNVPMFIPSFGGLLLKKEIKGISTIFKKRARPFVVIIGGAKIETKVNLIRKFINIADYILIGGGVGNVFLCAKGYDIGQSYCEYEKVKLAQRLLLLAKAKKTKIITPSDVTVFYKFEDKSMIAVKEISELSGKFKILDIGPKTIKEFSSIISKGKTLAWNGPLGYTEKSVFRNGTSQIYKAVVKNKTAVSLIGGGDTIAAISSEKKSGSNTHISTGGGAMLQYIENGDLPGIRALHLRKTGS